MHHNNTAATTRSRGVLPRHKKWPHLSAILAALAISFGLVAFSFTASPGGGSLNLLGAKVASADGGHGKGSKAATQTPTPARDHQPNVTDAHDETEMSDTEKRGEMEDKEDMGAEAAEEVHSDQEGTGEATQAPQSSPPQGDMDMDDGPEGNSSEEIDINEEHEDASADEHDSENSSGTDDHDDASSEAEGSHTEYEGPSDLVRNITLGGFAGINGSVLLAAAILKRKNPKKEKGRRAANSVAPTRALGGVTTVSTTSITGEVSTVSISLEAEPAPVGVAIAKAAPIDEAITTIHTSTIAGSPAPKGDDLA